MNSDTRVVKELFCRLFVIAIRNKTNLSSFTYLLERSVFLPKIEENTYDEYFNKPLEDIFFDITNDHIEEDDSYGIYDDAYWAGASYFELFLETKKPFSYIFLKLPLVKMMDIYPIYHEMPFSSLVEYFHKLEKEKTIIRALCEQNKYSLTKLSDLTGINKATLSSYNASDEALYKGSFQNIISIASSLKAPTNLFIQKIL